MTGADSPVALNAGLYAECGFSVFPLVPKSKRPAVKEWQKTEYRFSDEVQEVLARCTGFGVVLTAQDLVIDIDPRNFKGEDKPHVRLFQDAGINPKGLAVIARTGSGATKEKGGLHLYFKLPVGVSIRKNIASYPGIDFLSLGTYVVGVGSIHPDTGRPYEWVGERDLRDRVEAPECLVRLIEKFVPAVGTGSDQFEVRTDTTTNLLAVESSDGPENFRNYLKNVPGAVQGNSGDAQTYRVCCKGRDFGLTAGQTLALVAEIYNPKCVPPWTREELETKVKNAYSYAKEKPGNALAVNEFEVVVQPENNPLYRGFDAGQGGKMAKTLNNAFNFFVKTPLVDSPLPGIIAWDEFNGQVKLISPAPWTDAPLPAGGQEWSDTDTTQLRLWINREKRVDFPTEVVDKAVLAAAMMKKIHPVRDFLDALRWDGKERLKTWLVEYAGAKDSSFVREASEKAILQAVNRMYNPGCKADYVLILEGNQGIGKSTLIEILGGQWYADIVIDPHARDTADALRGKWFVELSEMEVTKRADANALKAFITRKVDRFRLAYGRRAVDLPRQCTFIGTINPDATNEYLADSTGNRRFWPIWIRQVQFDALSAVREQLFAEAVVAVKQGKATHILNREALIEASNEQRKRQATDPWVEAVNDWIKDQKIDFLTTKDVWVFGLRGKETDLNLAQQRRIAGALRELGWVPEVKWVDGRSQRGYKPLVNVEALI